MPEPGPLALRSPRRGAQAPEAPFPPAGTSDALPNLRSWPADWPSSSLPGWFWRPRLPATTAASSATVQARIAAARAKEARLTTQISDVTSQIRSLERKVGDVSQKLSILERDLALHQRRLDRLNELFNFETERLNFLRTSVRKRRAPAELAHDRHLRDARSHARRGDPRVEVVPGRARPDSLPRGDCTTGQTHRRRGRRRARRGPRRPRAHEDDPHPRALRDAGRCRADAATARREESAARESGVARRQAQPAEGPARIDARAGERCSSPRRMRSRPRTRASAGNSRPRRARATRLLPRRG